MSLSCALALSLACTPTVPSSRPPDPPGPSSAEPPSGNPISASELLALADARTLHPRFAQALTLPRAGLRATAALALARLHHPDARPLLFAALRDPDADVRLAAALGLGAHPDHDPELADRLATALAAEPEASVRAALLRDLGRVAPLRLLPIYAHALREGSAPERAGACRGLLELVRRAVSTHPLPALAASLLAPDQPHPVRLACAAYLARSGGEIGPPLQAPLEIALHDADPEVRRYATRAYGRLPGAQASRLVPLVQDPDWRVAIAALHVLGTRATADDDIASELPGLVTRLYVRATPDRRLLSGPPLHRLLAGLRALQPLTGDAAVLDVAARLHGRTRTLVDGDARDRGLLHCALAELIDRARRWPTRLSTCGLGTVTEAERHERVAVLLGTLSGAEPPRLGRLRRFLTEEAPPRVQEAALRSLARLETPDALAPVLTALATTDDPGVTAAGCDAVAERWRRALEAPPSTSATATLRDVLLRLDCVRDLEPLAACLTAAEALDPATLAEPLRRLSSCEHPVVHAPARALLTRANLDLPPLPERQPPRPVRAATLRSRPRTLRVRLRTRRGDLVLRLWPEDAPTTVHRFLELARDGFYRDLSFHRVVPGFVVQGGDPRADGYGGPGWTQRCEDHRRPYRRGTVGMALAGRDTGGSQFFITYGAEPGLELRYTAFGVVEEGLDVLDRLQVGDVLQGVELL